MQPIEQMPTQPPVQQVEQSVPVQSSSNMTAYVVVGVAVVVAALALWYIYAAQIPPVRTEIPTATTEAPASEQAQTPASANGNTTANISAELNQVSNTSSALDADAAASANDVQSL